MARDKATRTVAAFKLAPHQREGLELVARGRKITTHEVVRRAVVAYVAACFEDSLEDNAEAVADPDREPDLDSWRRGGSAFPDQGD